MAVINTTDIIDSSIYLKANLKDNMVGDNYYIENLQYKRNADWEFRSNKIRIEEELHKQSNYSSKLPNYTPIEVVIRSVKDEKGKDLGCDWAQIAFKDLYHPNKLGSRYRFDMDGENGFKDLSNMSEEEKYYETCIWLGINRTPQSAGNSIVIRRCNSNMTLIGSPTGKQFDATEIRYEPIILENDLKYINMYYNQSLVIPQAEWYITAQLNYFTNDIKINDRLILGTVDTKDTSNNAVYKVKAIVKAASTKTFSKLGDSEINKIPLMVIALDKDVIADNSLGQQNNVDGDNFVTRVAKQNPLYIVKKDVQQTEEEYPDDYQIAITDSDKTRILLGEEIERKVYFDSESGQIDGEFTMSCSIKYLSQKTIENYLSFTQISNNSFKIKNKRAYSKNDVVITISGVSPKGEALTQKFNFQLGGFY